jgi:hypothetical protein
LDWSWNINPLKGHVETTVIDQLAATAVAWFAQR